VLLVLYTLANIALVVYESTNQVILHTNGDPGVQLNSVYYYQYLDTSQTPPVAYLNSTNTGVANYMSGVYLALYGEDYARFLVPVFALGWTTLAVPCGIVSTLLPSLFIVLVALYDLGKAIYFTFVWYSTFSTTQCAEFAFCTTHQLGTDPSTPDVTFKVETYAAYAFAVYAIFILITLAGTVQSIQQAMIDTMLTNTQLPIEAHSDDDEYGGTDNDSDDDSPHRRRKYTHNARDSLTDAEVVRDDQQTQHTRQRKKKPSNTRRSARTGDADEIPRVTLM